MEPVRQKAGESLTHDIRFFDTARPSVKNTEGLALLYRKYSCLPAAPTGIGRIHSPESIFSMRASGATESELNSP